MSDTAIKDILLRVLKQIAPDADPYALQPDDNIRETLGIDSFDSLQVMVALDEKLGVEIPEQDYGKVASLEQMVAYLKTKVTIDQPKPNRPE
jgi:acyl carrier protein